MASFINFPTNYAGPKTLDFNFSPATFPTENDIFSLY